jgi:hypothetical protein
MSWFVVAGRSQKKVSDLKGFPLVANTLQDPVPLSLSEKPRTLIFHLQLDLKLGFT